MRHLRVGKTGFRWLFGPATTGMVTGAWLSGRLAGHSTRLQTIGGGVLGDGGAGQSAAQPVRAAGEAVMLAAGFAAFLLYLRMVKFRPAIVDAGLASS